MTRLLMAGALMAALVAATMTTSAVGAADPPAAVGERYVALGDSTAAGPGILPQTTGLPCQRSARNFPTLAAAALGAESFTDATCTGASTAHLANPRIPEVPPQLDSLSADTTLVSLGPIGGNDVDINGVIEACLEAGCKERDGQAVHTRIAALRAKFAAALGRITERSPRAVTVVVGYGTYFPPGGCEGVQPFTGSDSDYIQSLLDQIDDELADAAGAAGATFADTRLTPGALDHTACAASARWLEGYTALDGARPLHPTALGMQAHATAVVAAAQRARARQQAIDQGRLEADRASLDADRAALEPEMAQIAAGRAALEDERAGLAADRQQLAAEHAQVNDERLQVDAERVRLASVRTAQLAAATRSVRGQAVCRGSKVVFRVLSGSPLATTADFRVGSHLIGRDTSTPLTYGARKASVKKLSGSFTARVRLSLDGASSTATVKISRPRCSKAS